MIRQKQGERENRYSINQRLFYLFSETLKDTFSRVHSSQPLINTPITRYSSPNCTSGKTQSKTRTFYDAIISEPMFFPPSIPISPRHRTSVLHLLPPVINLPFYFRLNQSTFKNHLTSNRQGVGSAGKRDK